LKHVGVILPAWMSIIDAGQDIYVCKNARVSMKAEKAGRF
jgi:hypothetical protein